MAIDRSRDLGALVRRLREQALLTQEELAERAGLSVRTVRGVESGRIGRPRSASVRLLAEALGLTGQDRDTFVTVAAATAQPGGQHAAAAVPAQLPPDVAAFTGRQEQLAQLDGLLLAQATDQPTAIVISAISGTAGVGKTALAVHWAHRVADRFPDGQLYVNLRGYHPGRPVPPGEALARLLTGLGVDGQDLPLDLEDRAARYRSELAHRQLLIVLDNASSVEQVRPLLPGTRSCAVVVTGRDRLAGLVALHGAHRLVLDLLPSADAVTLLRQLIGARVEADPAAAAELAEQCSRLPLALRVASERAAARPASPLAELVAELRDRQHRLVLLDGDGHPPASVRAVFSWSVQQLPATAVRTFRLLGLHPGPDLDRYAAAALAGTRLEVAGRSLELLLDAYLLHPTGPGRYGMHDLLRAYAGHLAGTEEPAAERDAAIERLLGYYAGTAVAAMDRLHPAEAHLRRSVPKPTTPTPALADLDTARTWLDGDRACLVAAVAHATANGWHNHAVQQSGTLARYLENGHLLDALAVHEHAYHAAGRAGDPAGQANAQRLLATIYDRTGEHELAAEHFQQALARFRQTGDLLGEARTLNSLGNQDGWIGRRQMAAERYEQALALFRKLDDQTGEAVALLNLGNEAVFAGHHQRAIDYYSQALALFQRLRHYQGEANTLNNLGSSAQRQGDYAAAAGYWRHAVQLFQRLGDLVGEALAQSGIGLNLARLGRPDQAIAHLEQLHASTRDLTHPQLQASILNNLGEATRRAGRHTDAVEHFTQALSLAASHRLGDAQGTAHLGLGQVSQALGHPGRARTHYERAIAYYTDFEPSRVDEVRARLAQVRR